MQLFLFKVFIKIVGLRRCFSVHFLNCKLLHIKDQTLIVINISNNFDLEKKKKNYLVKLLPKNLSPSVARKKYEYVRIVRNGKAKFPILPANRLSDTHALYCVPFKNVIHCEDPRCST